MMNNGNPAKVNIADSSSFKYKSRFFKSLTDTDSGVYKNVKIVVPLQYLSNIWRSLEMPLTNFKIYLKLDQRLCNVTIADTTFKITNTKLYLLLYQLFNCYFIKQRQCKTGKTITRRI